MGNFSPVKRRRAILVRSLRHLKGDIGEELKSRAEPALASSLQGMKALCPTFLEHGCPIHLQDRLLGVLIFLSVTHGCEIPSGSVAGCKGVTRGASIGKPTKGIQPTNTGVLAVEGGAPSQNVPQAFNS